MADDLELVNERLDEVLSMLAQILERMTEFESRWAAVDSPLITGEESEVA
jgi:hypothetical protein